MTSLGDDVLHPPAARAVPAQPSATPARPSAPPASAWRAERWSSVRRWEPVFVGLLLVAALGLRAVRPDLAQVGYDESAAASLALAWPLDGVLPLTGIVSSVGIPNPPAWPYLMAPVLLLSPTPQALVAEGVAISLLALGLTWWIGRRWLGVWGGLAAAVCYAFGFWSTLLGRSPWQPAFLQVPALLCLDALLLLGVRRWPWALALACGWLGLMVQLHYIAVAYVLLLPLAAWPARRALRPVHLLAGLLAGLLPLLPFLIYELHPMVRFRDLGFLLGQAGGGSRLDLSAWSLLWTLAGNGGAAGLGGAGVPALRDLLGRWSSLGLLGDVLLAAGLVVAIFDGVRGRLLAAWVLLPTVVLIRHSLDVLFHYLYVDLPAVALCTGLLVAWTSRQRRPWRLLVAGVLAVYAAVSVATLGVVLTFVETHDVSAGYGMPLRFSLAAAEAVERHLPPGGHVLIGGPVFQTAVLRFALGYNVPSSSFDDCGPPATSADVYLILHEQSPAAAALAAAGAPLLERVARPGDAYVILGPPSGPTTPAAASCPG